MGIVGGKMGWMDEYQLKEDYEGLCTTIGDAEYLGGTNSKI